MRTKLFILAMAFAASLSAPVLARSGTPDEQDACRPDVRRFCHHIHQDAGDMVFLSCLQEHRAKLSGRCRGMLESHGQ